MQNAIIAAGYEAQLYDFSPRPGLFDCDEVIKAISPSVGVLIVTHYFGVPIDFSPVLEHCAANGITVIEACAHQLGGSIGERTVGTIGDAAIYSFNYDKPISLGWGGIALLNNPTSFDLNVEAGYRAPGIGEELALLEQFVESMSYRRRIIPKQQSFAHRVLRRARILRTKRFCKSTDISIGAIQAELGRWCLKHYSAAVKQRNANSKRLAEEIPQPSWPINDNVEPAWIKQKVYIEDTVALKRLSKRLQCCGLRVGNFNWPTLLKGENGTNYRHALQASTNWVDVPIHQNVTDQHLEKIIAAFNEVA